MWLSWYPNEFPKRYEAARTPDRFKNPSEGDYRYLYVPMHIRNPQQERVITIKSIKVYIYIYLYIYILDVQRQHTHDYYLHNMVTSFCSSLSPVARPSHHAFVPVPILCQCPYFCLRYHVLVLPPPHHPGWGMPYLGGRR